MPTVTYAIDAWIPDQGRMTGVQQYSFRLIQAMKTHALREGERVILYTYKPLTGEMAQLPEGWEERVLAWPPRRGWMSLRVGWEMLRRPPSVLFVPGQGLPARFPLLFKEGLGVVNIVTTVHDVAFARRPDLYHPTVRRRLHRVTRDAIKKAAKILVPTQATKRDLIELYRVADDRVVVVPLAQSQTPPNPPLAGGGSSLFLTIGRLEKKKNITTLIRAFDLFKSRRGVGDPFELVLVGSPGYGYDEIKTFIDRSPYKDQIRQTGYLVDADVADLLARATAYVFPSWYEGFGIPNLDAMAADVPLITSDIPAHREVVGDAGLFVPPDAPQEWAHAMEQIVREIELRMQLIEKGKQRVANFSWEKTAAQTWEVLRSLV